MRSLILLAFVCAASAQLFRPFGQEGEKCSTVADCKAEECCVHSSIHKRFFLDDFFGDMFSGRCRPTRKEGESCVPFHGKMKMFGNENHFAMCPCSTGLECTSDKQTITDHPLFGNMESHSNAMCSKPEE